MINSLIKQGLGGSNINIALIGTNLFVTKSVGQLLIGN
jgi:hypothetical protein